MRVRSLPGFSVAALACLAAPGAWAQNAFVTNTADNTVSIVDVPSGTVIGAVPVDSEPQGVAVAPDGTTAYVTNLFGDDISVIDAAQFPQRVVATIASGTFPPGVAIAADGSAGYFTNGLATTPRVSAFSTATNAITANIGLPGTPSGVAVSPDGKHVYAASGTTTGIVSVISTATNAITASIPVSGSPDSIAVTPDGSKAYVTHFLSSGLVSVINLATNTVAGTIAVGDNPVGIAVSPDGTRAYVANSNDNDVSVIDTAADSVTATIPVGQGPFGVSVSANGASVYAANKTDNTLSQIDAASQTVVATINVGSAPAALGNFVGKVAPQSAVLSSILPGGRSVQVGATASVFATILNIGAVALSNCRIVLPSSAPAGLTLSYVTTNAATNVPNSTANPLVTIAGNGSQSFELNFQSTAATTDPAQPLLFVCAATGHAPIVVGLNSVDLQFSSTPIPDVLAIAATATGDGIVDVPLSSQQEGAFAVASQNAGADGSITVSADTGTTSLPISLMLCQTSAGTGQCLAPPAPSVTLDFQPSATPTFSVFVAATGAVAFSPATARVFVRFADSNGNAHGSTSVAVRTN
jgi:YVTN family beta-propeller protein